MNGTEVGFRAHIDEGHCFGFEKQKSEERAAFSGAPSGRVAGGGGFLGLKPQAESVVPLRGTEPRSSPENPRIKAENTANPIF